MKVDKQPISQEKNPIVGIQKLLGEAFDEKGFEVFCFERLLEVYEKFDSNMSFNKKVGIVLSYGHCDKLLTQFKNIKPDSYDELNAYINHPQFWRELAIYLWVVY